ncbi:MAG TPA: glycosyltransferase family 4 protein [Blastocatellia bacterium]|nr:glycosyltransferase family 4 protein [Blastocatellia bacterium]
MRILWLKTELLHPVDKGGRIRTYQMLKRLKRDHEITYLTLVSSNDAMEAFERASEYCHRLVSVPEGRAEKFTARFYLDLLRNVASPLPYAIERYRSARMREAIASEMSERNADVVVCDFLAPSVNFPDGERIASVLFQHNVESTIWQRHYETQANIIKRAFFRSQWQKMLAYERAACSRFDAVIAVSEIDRERMRDEFGLKEVYDVPTGVDTEFFQPMASEPNPRELVFTGSMDWMPNEDAILYFADKILPIITRAIPEAMLTVVGRNPAASLIELAKSNPQIKLTGRVEDIRPFVDRAAAYVVPLRVGGGTRLKIYEAMAMRKPVISTSVGAEGLPVRDGEELLIADEPDEFARAVIRVLSDAHLAKRLGEQARAAVCERFGWERAASAFAEVCETVAARRARRHAA